jgi:hypothetical protein
MEKFSKEQFRSNWRKSWLQSLLGLADFDLQKERWLHKDITNPAWTYVEFMCGYFDDLQIRDAGQDYEAIIKDGRVSKAEYECIKDFHQALSAYKDPNNDAYNVEAIISDPKWQRVVSIGAAAVKKLEPLITDPQEHEIFSKKLYAPPLKAGDFTWPNHDKKPH